MISAFGEWAGLVPVRNQPSGSTPDLSAGVGKPPRVPFQAFKPGLQHRNH